MKSLRRLGMLCGVVVALVCLSGVLFADPEGEEVGAVIIKDIGCYAPGSLWGGPNLTTEESHTVVTKSGNVKLTCKFEVPEGEEPEKAVKAEGFSCGILAPAPGPYSTTDTQLVVSAGGIATLQCMVKPDTNP